MKKHYLEIPCKADFTAQTKMSEENKEQVKEAFRRSLALEPENTKVQYTFDKILQTIGAFIRARKLREETKVLLELMTDQYNLHICIGEKGTGDLVSLDEILQEDMSEVPDRQREIETQFQRDFEARPGWETIERIDS